MVSEYFLISCPLGGEKEMLFYEEEEDEEESEEDEDIEGEE